MIGITVGLAAGAAIGWLLRSRSIRDPSLAGGVHGGLIPDPALRWLVRAHGARGLWISEGDTGEGPRNERLLDDERLNPAEVALLDRRVEHAREGRRGGTERVAGGSFVVRVAEGFAAGLLLPETVTAASLSAAETDLDRLLDGLARVPEAVALAQAGPDEGSLETIASVAIRLAYQLERITASPAAVAVAEPAAVRIAGTSSRADRRLADTFAAAESPLGRLARGTGEGGTVSGDVAGTGTADRRQRTTPAFLAPITFRGQTVGAAAIWTPTGELAGSALAETREALASAAPRLERALHQHGLEQQAFLDPLTGLANRRALERAMQRHPPPDGALVAIDLDRFKPLNDTLGHAAGDAALLHVARLLRDQVRSGDVAARVGGEEFALWLPGASLEVGSRIAERVRVKLGTTAWHWQGTAWPLSASFGVSCCPETTRRVDNLAAQADAALYVAKRSGRNRVEAAARV